MPRPCIDITGQRFGSQTVIECTTEKRDLRTYSYLVLRCDCGNVTKRRRERPRTMCANCAVQLSQKTHEDANKAVVGKRSGKLTVVARHGTKSTNAKYTVRCDCGNEYTTRADKFKGRTMCWNCHLTKNSPQADLEKGTHKHPLVVCWRGMIRRCYDETSDSYPSYGAKGVTVCDRWRGKCEQGQKRSSIDGFHNFLEDMGPKPGPEYSIDRIDPYGNYEPDNCRWATPEEQQANKRGNTHVSRGTT